MNRKLFESDPREFALQMVSDGLVDAQQLLLCALEYMSHDEVRDMLASNEMPPRFHEDHEDEDEDE